MAVSSKSTNEMDFILDDDQLDILYSWVDEFPLSRSKRNMARDFSDSVLLAEILSYFFPNDVNMRYFPATYSSEQKKINWTLLNQKTLPKLGMKLSEAKITKLVEAKAGLIEQVIWEIRNKLPNPKVNLNAKRSTKRIGSVSVAKIPSVKSKIASSYASAKVEMPKVAEKIEQIEVDQNQNYIVDTPEEKSAGEAGVAHACGIMVPELGKPTMEIGAELAAPLAATNKKSVQSTTRLRKPSPSTIKNPNHPAQILYGGQRMIPSGAVEQVEEKIKTIEVENKDLTKKIHRMETLVGLKDQRIEDLTNQLHNLHDLYERVQPSVSEVDVVDDTDSISSITESF